MQFKLLVLVLYIVDFFFSHSFSCGKTTICQLIAALHNQRLHCLNCHQCTEASDFLGELRPVRHSSEGNEKEVSHIFFLFP